MRRWTSMWIAVVALVAVLAAACSSSSSAATSWEAVPEAPLSPRIGSALAWTGTEILVVGGGRSDFLCPPNASCVPGESTVYSDGAAFNPATNTWRTMPDAPVPVPGAETARIDELAFFRTAGAILVYDSSTDAWATIDRPPANNHSLIATDTNLVLYAVSDELDAAVDWSFDLQTGVWSELPVDPLGAALLRTMVSDGQALFVFEVEVPGERDDSAPPFARGAKLEADTWETLPLGSIIGFASESTLVADDRIVFANPRCSDGGNTNGYGRCIPTGGTFTISTGTWAELDNNALGLGQRDTGALGAVSPTEVVFESLGLYYDTEENRWFNVPMIDDIHDGVQRRAQGVGPFGFAFGGGRFGPDIPSGELLSDVWIWDPNQLRPSD